MGLPSREFTPTELKKCYREASKIYHPDKNPDFDTTDKFLEVKTAAEILGGDFGREQYELFFQTKFEMEENLIHSLEIQGLKKDEVQQLFWQQVFNKRFALAAVEAIPSAIAWTLTTILLVNVSH